MHKKSFMVVVITVTLFVAFMLGYSIPPYLHSGAFSSEREQKGVAIEIDEDMEKYYQDLYGGGEEE